MLLPWKSRRLRLRLRRRMSRAGSRRCLRIARRPGTLRLAAGCSSQATRPLTRVHKMGPAQVHAYEHGPRDQVKDHQEGQNVRIGAALAGGDEDQSRADPNGTCGCGLAMGSCSHTLNAAPLGSGLRATLRVPASRIVNWWLHDVKQLRSLIFRWKWRTVTVSLPGCQTPSCPKLWTIPQHGSFSPGTTAQAGALSGSS